MLLVAMSALQGRPQDTAFDALAALPVDGVQLTPGNLPSEGFESKVRAYTGAVRMHHGFAFEAYRVPVHDARGRSCVRSRAWSIHPPDVACVDFDGFLAQARADDDLCETMYPGHHLGTGAELERAMRDGLRLAVDVSHLHIQVAAGVIAPRTRARLFDYDRVEEVHVSHNDGRRDAHRPLDASTPHLAWVRARLAAGAVVVYESYVHRLDDDARRRQLTLIRSP